MNAYRNQYQENQIKTASSEQILVMLYDGAIRFSVQAMEGIAEGDRVKRAEMINKVLGIVTLLSDTLDHGTGGEIATNLDALYTFMIRELSQANLDNDPAHLQTVRTLLSDLRQTWVEAIEVQRQEKGEEALSGQPSQLKTAVL